MTKVVGMGVLLFAGRVEPVEYNYEATETGGYGRINGEFDLNEALGWNCVALQLDTGETISVGLRDAHPVTGSRFDILTDSSPRESVNE